MNAVRADAKVAWTVALALTVAGALWPYSPAGATALRVLDDRGTAVELVSPARRIVSLAPHITELLFAAGAGDRVVGTVDYSDFPSAAKAIPRIGSSSRLDLERIAELRPDVIVVWWHGTPESELDRLRALRIPLYYNNVRSLEDVPATLERFGALAGSSAEARQAKDLFIDRLATLRARYAHRRPVRVFWQIWSRPLLTVNGRHLISDVLRLCGGTNIFEQLPALVTTVSMEAVVQADPDVIVTTITDAANDGTDGLDAWRKLKTLRATTDHHLIALRAETVHRPSQRILDGAEDVCAQLDAVRSGRR